MLQCTGTPSAPVTVNVMTVNVMTSTGVGQAMAACTCLVTATVVQCHGYMPTYLWEHRCMMSSLAEDWLPLP